VFEATRRVLVPLLLVGLTTGFAFAVTRAHGWISILATLGAVICFAALLAVGVINDSDTDDEA
jgi:hypothetical protein